LKVAQLRNIYQKEHLFNRFNAETIGGFGLNHIGQVSTMTDFMAADILDTYTAQQKADIAAFVLCFDTGTAPAVGYTMTLTEDNVADGALRQNWMTLQQQARVRNIDVFVRGTVDGEVREMGYRPLFDDYYVFRSFPAASLTRAQLLALIARGDTLTVMGVPPREGINRASATSLTSAPATDVAAGRRPTSRGH
jgi:hypothetical protein